MDSKLRRQIKSYKERLENKWSEGVYNLSGGDPDKIVLLEEELSNDLDEIQSLYERLELSLKEFYQWSYRLEKIKPSKVYFTYDKPLYFIHEDRKGVDGDEFAPEDLFHFLIGKSDNKYFYPLDYDSYWESQYERNRMINETIVEWLGEMPEDDMEAVEYEQRAWDIFPQVRGLPSVDIHFLEPVEFDNQKKGVMYLKDSFDYWYVENASDYTDTDDFIFVSNLAEYIPFGSVNWKKSRL